MANEKKIYRESYRGKQFSIRKLEERKWMWYVHGVGARPSFCSSKDKAVTQAREAIDRKE